MITYKPSFFLHLPLLAVIFFATLLFAGQADGADDFGDLFRSMRDRQEAMENELQSDDQCLGEDINGFLYVNSRSADCTRAITLAKEENDDRLNLYQIMAAELGQNPREVGREVAKWHLGKYKKGILREVRVSDIETTWWDGTDPDPRRISVTKLLALKGAKIYKEAGRSSGIERDHVQRYEVFGAIDMKNNEGERWYQVTENYVPKIRPKGWTPRIAGWIAESDIIPWPRALGVKFTNPGERKDHPILFFDSIRPLQQLVEQDATRRKIDYNSIISHVRQTGKGKEKGVVAIEPPPVSSAITNEASYYPLLDFYPKGGADELRMDGQGTKLLEIAGAIPDAQREENFASDVCTTPVTEVMFVVDTTESMAPYLPTVLHVIKNNVMHHENILQQKNIKFSIIGYRDKHPTFDYLTKEYTKKFLSPEDFVSVLNTIKVQSVPAKGDDIPEAVFQGLYAALDSKLWSDKAVQIIMLIGDAPGRNEDNLSVESLHKLAHRKTIPIPAFHIKNSLVSAGWDKQAQSQYEMLSRVYQGAYGASLSFAHFYSIDAKHKFEKSLDEKISDVLEGITIMDGKTDLFNKRETKRVELPTAELGTMKKLIFEQAVILLANCVHTDEELPRSVKGWIADKDVNKASLDAIVHGVLLTEGELEELAHRVRELKMIAETIQNHGEGGTTLDFFDLVSQNTKFTIVDPTAVNFRDAFSIPLGIDQIPYQSDIMAATRDNFQNPDTVDDFIRSMEEKLNDYELLKQQRGNSKIWKKMNRNAKDGESVVFVETKALP